jgi:hypothetical protein
MLLLLGFAVPVGTAQIVVFGPGNTLLAFPSNTSIGDQNIVISGLGSIERVYFNSAADAAGAIIDNFVATPEPTTALLLGCGLIGLAVAQRRVSRPSTNRLDNRHTSALLEH